MQDMHELPQTRDLLAFVAIVEDGGFAEASRRLGVRGRPNFIGQQDVFDTACSDCAFNDGRMRDVLTVCAKPDLHAISGEGPERYL